MISVLTALGLALALEGVAYAAFPAFMKRAMTAVLSQPPEQLRAAGLACAALGVGLVWAAQRLF